MLQAVLSSVAKAESPRRYRGVSWQESTDLKEIFSFSVSSVGMCSGGLVLRLREKQKAVHDLLAVFFDEPCLQPQKKRYACCGLLAVV